MNWINAFCLAILALTSCRVLAVIPIVAAGSVHSYVLKSNGTVLGFGGLEPACDDDPESGIVCDGPVPVVRPDQTSVPLQVLGLTQGLNVAAGVDHAIVLNMDGTVWAWGSNGSGQLGNGTTDFGEPAPVSGLEGVLHVAAGGGCSLAVTKDGTVWAWGNNDNGQLGDGTHISRSRPVKVSGLRNVSLIATALDSPAHTVALDKVGTVWAWGENGAGELGDGSTISRITPAQVPGLTGVIAIAAGGGAADGWGGHTLALKHDGTVMAWGNNHYGQLGDGTTIDRHAPVQVKGVSGITAIAAGYLYSLALRQDGTVLAWGWNGVGQLGDGTDDDRMLPVSVTGLSKIVSIAAGSVHNIALKKDGTVWAWGDNSSGQLGIGTLIDESRTSELVLDETITGFLDLNPEIPNDTPENKIPPFLLVASGKITDTSAMVNLATKFNAEDKGKNGAVYVTARVPAGSLGTSPVAALSLPQQAEKLLGAVIPSAYAQTTSSPTVLMQLTPTGWQPVTNGQLIPYASGVLGDALAAQTILNGVDTSNLKGAEFCLGYGTSAAEMGAAGRMRTVATIPGGSTSIGCLPLTIPKGWNLLGHGLNQSFPVASLYGDTSWVNSVWKWDTTKGQWQFYAPLMDSVTLSSFTKDKGYGILTDIFPGEGYWVNATKASSVIFQSGSPYTLTSSNLKAGWNLAATGATTTPSAFNTSLSTTPPAAGTTPQNFTSLWAWDNANQNWYFYAPSLDAQGGTTMTDYLTSKGYIDFTTNGKILGPTTGFWVNR